MSGRTVILRIFTEEHNIHKCAHAMVSLKKSMKWDEDTYGTRPFQNSLFSLFGMAAGDWIPQDAAHRGD
jgi:hypothetical protein